MSSTPPSTGPLHLLVTAGPTREKIDAVRDWGNIFTGQTGLDLALAFLTLGHVTLLTSNPEHVRDYDGYSGARGMIGTELFRSHADLQQLLAERLTAGDPVHVVAMTAAVADYQPAGTYRILSRTLSRTRSVSEGEGSVPSERPIEQETWLVEPVPTPVGQGKVKSTFDQIAIRGTRTSKLIDMFRTTWSFQGLLIKFKLEVDLSDQDLIQVAQASRLASQADLIVANTLAMARPKDGTQGGAFLLDAHSTTRIPRPQLAGAVADWVKACLLRD